MVLLSAPDGESHEKTGIAAAYNYREGRVFKPGDKVYRGEIIGYTGRTGNAWDVPNKHLHLVVKNSTGRFIDPEPFLNGTIYRNGKSVSDKTLKNIKCDNEKYMDINVFGAITR